MKDLELTSYFFDSIELLRTKGDIILHTEFIQWSQDDEEYVTRFLSEEYQREAINYPGEIPDFNSEAALWGAKITFVAAQLLMLRNVKDLVFNNSLPDFEGEMSLSAVLSADLCLKFLPEIIDKAADIDPYDELIEWLENILLKWHFSGIGRRIETPQEPIKHLELVKDSSMMLLYSDRIVKRGAMHSVHQEIKEIVKPFL